VPFEIGQSTIEQSREVVAGRGIKLYDIAYLVDPFTTVSGTRMDIWRVEF
jgi:hypothetical protein